MRISDWSSDVCSSDLAILHVQSSGKDTVTGANVLVALFSARESYAVYFLQQQDMSRLDAVSYISHGVGKGVSAPVHRAVKGAAEEKAQKADTKAKKDNALAPFTAITLANHLPEHNDLPLDRRPEADRKHK